MSYGRNASITVLYQNISDITYEHPLVPDPLPLEDAMKCVPAEHVLQYVIRLFDLIIYAT